MTTPIRKAKVSSIFGTNTDSTNIGFSDIVKKSSVRHCDNLPISSYTSRIWCQYFSGKYYEVYGERYPNYPSRIEAESVTMSSIVYPFAFDELKYSAIEFSNFLVKYINTMFNAKKELAILMLKTDASKSKMEHYIKQYRRLRKNEKLESLIYIPHVPFTGDEDDLQLILDSSNLNSIQILSNFGIPIFHKYITLKNLLSFEKGAKLTQEIVLREILLKYKEDVELLEKLLMMIAKNSILWEPYFDSKLIKKKGDQSLFVLDWRNEFSNIWGEFNFYSKDWWKNVENTSCLKPIPTVKKFFT